MSDKLLLSWALFTLIMVIAVFWVPRGAVHAATATVTNLNDSGHGSLRQAIADATPGDTINFGVTGAIILTSGELVISKDLAIDGPGSANLTINGNNAGRVLHISSGTVNLSGITVTNGRLDAAGLSGSGAGIFNESTLALTETVVRGNHTFDEGAGIANTGRLSVIRTTVSGNNAPFVSSTGGGASAGGILNNFGIVTITESTISDNNSGGSGGGIANRFGALTITNSTISGNTANNVGGGISNSGTLSLTNSTITNNTARNTAPSGGGGGIFWEGSATIVNTVIAGNTASPGPDCTGSGTLTSLGHNLIGKDTDCNYPTATGDLIGTGATPVDPLLGPLQDNGGPTFTHALLVGSPAIDAGDNGFAPPTDQRGVARPQGPTSDIGAFEVITVTTVVIDIKPGSDPNCFNNNDKGVIPVAILGSADFDATKVDDSTVKLEGLAVKAVGKKGNLLSHIEDVNADGLSDLVVQIQDHDSTFQEGTTIATLTGKLKAEFGGTPIEGTDSICITP